MADDLDGGDLGATYRDKMVRRAASAHTDPASRAQAEEIANAPLERQKFQLLHSISSDKRALAEVEANILAAEAQLLTRKQALSQSNALFMTLPDAAARAPRQRLGANNAVLETKRIIAREIARARKEADVMEMKLNKAKEKNAGVRAQVGESG